MSNIICEKCKFYHPVYYGGVSEKKCLYKALAHTMELQGKKYKGKPREYCPYYMEKLVIEQEFFKDE